MSKSRYRRASVKELARENDIVHVDPQFIYDEIDKISKQTGGTGAYKFKNEYLLQNLLSKLFVPGQSDPKLLRDAAFASFNLGEADCQRINNLDTIPLDPLTKERARSIIRYILGEFSYEKVIKDVRHGSGATFCRRRAFGDASYKYSCEGRFWSSKKKNYISNPKVLTCTPLAFKYYKAFACSTLLADYDKHNNICLVRGNLLDSVPKNSKTDRTIAKEPDCNMFLQLGVGGYLSRRLDLIGNSKFDQTRNQRYARIGSIDGSLSTIDLSRASDSLSFKLVYELLPTDWFTYLDDIRSHYYKDPYTGVFRQYEKFCTMGNGFCFELQTIIFLAIALSASNERVQNIANRFSTYGDDIICPSHNSEAVISALTLSGFTINPDKSFTEGPFRESCGKHYYNGIDVSPFFIRRPIDSLPRLCWLLNALRRWSYWESAECCDDSFYNLWLDLYRSFPILRKLRGGRDVNRTDYVVCPGRPTGRLVQRLPKIVLPELGSYLLALSGNAKPASKLSMAAVDSASELYHYSIHPEGDDYVIVGYTSNDDEFQLQPSQYKFLTEL